MSGKRTKRISDNDILWSDDPPWLFIDKTMKSLGIKPGQKFTVWIDESTHDIVIEYNSADVVAG